MGSNKFQNFIFSALCCFLMVTGMTLYNGVLQLGWQTQVLLHVFSLTFIAILLVAFFIDWFIVAPIVKGVIVARLLSPQAPLWQKIIAISGFMVLFMCIIMSLLATYFQGYQGSFLLSYQHTFAMNILFALPLQFLLAGPLARALFLMIFSLQIDNDAALSNA